MGRLAHQLTPRPLHEQRGPYFLNGANFHVALGEAERLGMDLDFKGADPITGGPCPEYQELPGGCPPIRAACDILPALEVQRVKRAPITNWG